MSNFEEVKDLQIQVSHDLGDVTVLVNNAGILCFSDYFNPKPEEIQNMINVNMTSHFWTNQVFLPKMKQLKRGYILAISSIAGKLIYFFILSFFNIELSLPKYFQCIPKHEPSTRTLIYGI